MELGEGAGTAPAGQRTNSKVMHPIGILAGPYEMVLRDQWDHLLPLASHKEFRCQDSDANVAHRAEQ